MHYTVNVQMHIDCVMHPILSYKIVVWINKPRRELSLLLLPLDDILEMKHFY